MQFCAGIDIRDAVTPANFGSHRFRRFRMAGVEFQVFFIDFRRRPYNTLALPFQRVIKGNLLTYLLNILIGTRRKTAGLVLLPCTVFIVH